MLFEWNTAWNIKNRIWYILGIKEMEDFFFYILISFLFSHICHLMFIIKQIAQYPPLIYSWLWHNSGKECFPFHFGSQTIWIIFEISLSGNALKWVKEIPLPHVFPVSASTLIHVQWLLEHHAFSMFHSYTRFHFPCHIKYALPVTKAVRSSAC